jgi:hypothetical protein
MRRVKVFFYGLFMDAELLGAKGIKTDLRPASLSGFQLRIGDRATLVPSAVDVVHGMIATLTHEEIERLYSEPSVREYRPEAVLARLGAGETVPALCFNLPDRPSPGERNPEYAAKLRALAERLGFPSDYVRLIV